MDELRELYQETILGHNRSPRNFGPVEGADHRAEGFNPLCGDHYFLTARFEGDTIAAVGFEGSGCAISKASASLMTEAVTRKTRAEVEELFQRFHRMLTGEVPADPAVLGKLAVFGGVCEFPVRVKCAALPWHILSALLRDQTEAVTTE